MSILQKHFEFVKQQIEHQKKMELKYNDNSFRADLHTATRNKLESLLKDLMEVDSRLDAPTIATEQSRQFSPTKMQLSLSELAGLPQELLAELSVSADETEFAILSIIDECGGIVSLDRLLLSLYQKTKEVHKRQNLTSRLYRMKDQVFGVPGKKGYYSNRRLSEDDVAALFGTGDQTTNDKGFFD